METKLCTQCDTVKPIDQFYKLTRPNGRVTQQSCCKTCSSRLSRKRYETPEYRAAVRARGSNAIREGQKLMREALSVGCCDCPETDIRCLDFDHVTGKKYKAVGALVRCGVGPAKVLKEISKCVVRCSNCHRKRTMDLIQNCWRTS